MKTFDKTVFKSVCHSGSYNEISTYLQNVSDADDIKKQYDDIFEKQQYVWQHDDVEINTFLHSYETYLWHAFTHQESIEQRKAFLFDKLQSQFPNASSWEQLEEQVVQFFKDRGYYALFGVTPPFPDLYAWKTQRQRTENVSLPYGNVQMQVYEMDDILSHGWYHYLALKHGGTAGWVSDDGAYYFKDMSDIESEEFQVSLLKHEGQHFYDLQMYPNMKSTDLEYRAKLVELIYGTDETRLLTFVNQQSNDPNHPHGYANKVLIDALINKFFAKGAVIDETSWKLIYDDVRCYARQLLDEHSNALVHHDLSTSLI